MIAILTKRQIYRKRECFITTTSINSYKNIVRKHTDTSDEPYLHVCQNTDKYINFFINSKCFQIKTYVYLNKDILLTSPQFT